jgi:protein-disulfide isomerase
MIISVVTLGWGIAAPATATNEEQMDACFADEELANRILQSRLDAQNQYEISSTPSFVIDGKTYSGALSVDEFAELIDPLLDGS